MADTSEAEAAAVADDLRRRMFLHHLTDFNAAWDRFSAAVGRTDRQWAWSLVAAAVAERDTGRG